MSDPIPDGPATARRLQVVGVSRQRQDHARTAGGADPRREWTSGVRGVLASGGPNGPDLVVWPDHPRQTVMRRIAGGEPVLLLAGQRGVDEWLATLRR